MVDIDAVCTILWGMKYINIVPIFNQKAPLVWSTIAAIQAAAMKAVHRYETSCEESAQTIAELNDAWHRFKTCFAFAAYDGDKMVGCIDGVVKKKVASVNGLYVLPQYHRMGIGGRLLASAERAASLVADDMELVILSRVRPFYEQRGYTRVERTDNLYRKSIAGAQFDAALPLFGCSPKLAQQCSDIAVAYDVQFTAASVNMAHMPTFVQLDKDMGLSGYIQGEYSDAIGAYRVTQLCINPRVRQNRIVTNLVECLAKMNQR